MQSITSTTILPIIILILPQVRLADKDGFTPLHYASQEGHLPVVKILLENGASWEDRNYQGVAPLHKAAQNNRHDVVRYLVTTAGCPVDIVSIFND